MQYWISEKRRRNDSMSRPPSLISKWQFNSILLTWSSALVLAPHITHTNAHSPNNFFVNNDSIFNYANDVKRNTSVTKLFSKSKSGHFARTGHRHTAHTLAHTALIYLFKYSLKAHVYFLFFIKRWLLIGCSRFYDRLMWWTHYRHLSLYISISLSLSRPDDGKKSAR